MTSLAVVIRRWLERLRAWWLAPISDHLRLIDARLKALEVERGMSPVGPQDVRHWDCGHDSPSGATYVGGRTECSTCHQEQFRRR